MSIVRTKPNLCPYCGHLFDRCGSFDEASTATAAPGDVSICIACAGLLVFRDDMTVRKMLEADFDKLSEADRRELAVNHLAVLALRGMMQDEHQQAGHA